MAHHSSKARLNSNFGIPPRTSDSNPLESEPESDNEYVNRNIRDLPLQEHMLDTAVDYSIVDNIELNHPPQERDRVQNCIDNHLYRRHTKNYFKAARKSAKYYRRIMMLYDTIHDELKFPVLPHKTGSTNHLSAQLWMVTYAMQEFADDIDEGDETNKLGEGYVKTIEEAIQIEKFLRNFKDPLSSITEIGLDLVNHMKRVMLIPLTNDDLTSSPPSRKAFVAGTSGQLGTTNDSQDSEEEEEEESEKISVGPKYYTYSGDARAPKGHTTPTIDLSKSIKESLLIGSSIHRDDVFDRIEIYTRTTSVRKWFLFCTLPRLKKISIVEEAVLAVKDSLAKLRKLLKPVLTALKQGVNAWCWQTTLLKHLTKMATSLQAVSYQYADMVIDDENPLIREIFQAEDRLYRIITSGRQIVRQILEVLGMSQLCYVFVNEGLKMPIKSFEGVMQDVLKSRKGKDKLGKFLFKVNDFKVDDFFLTKYPDVLRKVPVIINRTELSLHKCSDASMFRILGQSLKSATGVSRRIKKQFKKKTIPNEEYSRSRFQFNMS